MANYQHRLDRLEAAIVPVARHFIWRHMGESTEQAAKRYAGQCGNDINVAAILEYAVFMGWKV